MLYKYAIGVQTFSRAPVVVFNLMKEQNIVGNGQPYEVNISHKKIKENHANIIVNPDGSVEIMRLTGEVWHRSEQGWTELAQDDTYTLDTKSDDYQFKFSSSIMGKLIRVATQQTKENTEKDLKNFIETQPQIQKLKIKNDQQTGKNYLNHSDNLIECQMDGQKQKIQECEILVENILPTSISKKQFQKIGKQNSLEDINKVVQLESKPNKQNQKKNLQKMQSLQIELKEELQIDVEVIQQIGDNKFKTNSEQLQFENIIPEDLKQNNGRNDNDSNQTDKDQLKSQEVETILTKQGKQQNKIKSQLKQIKQKKNTQVSSELKQQPRITDYVSSFEKVQRENLPIKSDNEYQQAFIGLSEENNESITEINLKKNYTDTKNTNIQVEVEQSRKYLKEIKFLKKNQINNSKLKRTNRSQQTIVQFSVVKPTEMDLQWLLKNKIKIDYNGSQFNVLVMEDKCNMRSLKLLLGIAKGAKLVSYQWIIQSMIKECLLDYNDFPLIFSYEFEKKFNFKAKNIAVKSEPIFLDKTFFFPKSFKYHIDYNDIEELISFSGGYATQTLIEEEETETVILIPKDDEEEWLMSVSNFSCKLYKLEYLLDGVLNQKVDEKYQFVNRKKRYNN